MKLISLNVEGSKHWDLITPFLRGEDPDVVCLQEIYRDDAERIAAAFGMEPAFAPMCLRMHGQPAVLKEQGIAILSRLPMEKPAIHDYHLSGQALMEINETDHDHIDATVRRSLLSAPVHHEEGIFTVATTHFTLTPDGLPREYQYAAADGLFAALAAFPEIVLCGDFNMPRGVNALYPRFAKSYRDAIPSSYASSLDTSLHRAGGNPDIAKIFKTYMVDYLFLSQGYRAEKVRLQAGVSDHCAIVATVHIAA